ncbi:MAG: hypothetical protein DWG77_03060 [Chloroflexi bacterium]|nr:hypothetical protein [Chloroflexota bacterium]
MNSGEGRAPDTGGLLPHPEEGPHAQHVPGTWTADELQAALTRIDGLNRELHRVETALRVQQDEVARLHDSVQVVEGRTARHEVGQDQTRAVRQEIAELEERLAQEVSLRQDLSGQIERFQAREAALQQELHRALGVIASRLDDVDGRASADALRQRHIASEIAEVEHEGEGVEGRVESLERRVAAEFEGQRHLGVEVAKLAASVSQLLSAVDALEARARAITTDQHRLDEGLVALRAVRDRESELGEVIEQQRATRARLEDRMNTTEETLEALRQSIAAAADERSLLARDVGGVTERWRQLDERLTAQRDSLTEHLRRQSRANEESRRRLMEEMERDIRTSRSLLTRLIEDTDETEQEQPL